MSTVSITSETNPRRWTRFLFSSSTTVDRETKARARIILLILAFGAIYAVIAFRLIFLATIPEAPAARRLSSDALSTARPNLVDRNGAILAIDIKAPSLFAEPKKIIDVDEAAELLTAILPDLDSPELRERLGSKKGFIWLKREITKQQQQDIHRLGIPGIGFAIENKRVYPNGPIVSHLLGHVNVDNQGIAGIEKWLDGNGLADLHLAGLATDRLPSPVELAVDLRVQHALRDELISAKNQYKAQAAAGLILDVRTGEIIAMVSVPDYDPNNPKEANDPTRINRLTTGVYELGSTFKALTVAMALDSGRVTLGSSFDARVPLRYGRFDITDYHAQRRVLTVPEIFTYSSNIGTARMALALGVDAHKAFLKKLGQLDRLRTELPESAEPLLPKRWAELNTVTIAFGHGLSVAPLQAMMGVGALMNGGTLIPPTFLRRTEEEAAALGTRVVRPETSTIMRYLMRLNAEKGTATRADIKGFYVGGKTGTSEKVIGGRYSKSKLLTTFMAVMPADQPRYVLLIMLDEPQALPETNNYATSGWNAAPTAGRVIARIGPLLRLEPRLDLPPAERLILANSRASR